MLTEGDQESGRPAHLADLPSSVERTRRISEVLHLLHSPPQSGMHQENEDGAGLESVLVA